MNLEELIEILKAYGAVLGWKHFVSLLNGEETITEYLEGITKNNRTSLNEAITELEEERKRECPNIFVIGILQNRRKTIMKTQLRVSEYLIEKDKETQERQAIE